MPSTPSKTKPRSSRPVIASTMQNRSAAANIWHRSRFAALGTAWTIDLELPPTDGPSGTELVNHLRDRLTTYDRTYSRFRADSLVTSMSQQAGDYRLPDDARPLMAMYAKLYQLSAGQITPLIGDLLAATGYDADYSLRPQSVLPVVPAWEEAINYRHPVLTIKQPHLLDFGAAGKGYALDLLAAELEAAGVTAYCIDAGGDIRQRGLTAGADAIGLEHPDDPSMMIGIVKLGDRSLCGSATNRRSWGPRDSTGRPQFHHIIDPHRRRSTSGITAAWAVAADGLTADAAATALFFVEPDVVARALDCEYAILTPGPAGPLLQASPQFPAEFYCAT